MLCIVETSKDVDTAVRDLEEAVSGSAGRGRMGFLRTAADSAGIAAW